MRRRRRRTTHPWFTASNTGKQLADTLVLKASKPCRALCEKWDFAKYVCVERVDHLNPKQLLLSLNVGMKDVLF